jgi:imidazolonepropionase-like amidohydrolase
MIATTRRRPRPIAPILLALAFCFAAAGQRHAAAEPVVLINAEIYPATSDPIPSGYLRVADGKIAGVGPMSDYAAQEGERVVDASGKRIVPGFIDAHSHMGVYSWPSVEAHSDGNEMTQPVTAHVRAQDAINLEDEAFFRALAGGMTTIHVLPGSGNLIGGETVVLKLRLHETLEGMKLKGAPRGIKMAMGENPKRVYGGKGELPSTRMGNVAKLREVFTEAKRYGVERERHAEKTRRYEEKLARYQMKKAEAGDDAEKLDKVGDEPEPPEPFERDLLSETLVDVMEGRVLVHVHCYRKDDLLDYLRVSDEFGFKPHVFHHGLECYKIADELAKRDIGVVTWPDWWGFKMEAYEATPWNMRILNDAGVMVAMHSDSALLAQRYPYEAAKTIRYGLDRKTALETITIRPAKLLGIDQWVGSLEVGKDADFAVMDGDVFDIYSRVVETWLDGEKVFDREIHGDQF